MITPGKQKTGGTAPGDTNKRNQSNKTIMAKEIIVKRGVQGKIAAEIGCHPNSVKLALAGVTDSEMANRIRELAKKKYGGR